MELRCITFQKEVVSLKEKVKVAYSLQVIVEIHGSPYDLIARVTKLEDSLKDVEKQYHVA